jgi:hypothetical protein
MFKKKESDFRYFNEEWNSNEPTTDGDYLEDGIDDFVSTPSKSEAVED